jgi:hypothetical protein
MLVCSDLRVTVYFSVFAAFRFDRFGSFFMLSPLFSFGSLRNQFRIRQSLGLLVCFSTCCLFIYFLTYFIYLLFIIYYYIYLFNFIYLFI